MNIQPIAHACALAISVLCTSAFGQTYKSVESYVHFFSKAPMEDIEAVNEDGQSAIDLEKQEMVFSIPIKSFTFEKSLMQEHFNENYMESDKYPKANFRGKIVDLDAGNATLQKVKAIGKMTIHGVEQPITVEGEISVNEKETEINAKFPIRLEDYKIKIPKVVFYNIAEVVDVTIKFRYEKIN